ncbi:hypothetical protein AQI88_19620 [Streptomyces cellostaticus]|uniref:Uncharacterized protein n=1 Tax=Streptomyces cellostaticus TaxID=67285 RepID=A0A101NL71_9ACTN|nr:hypothetical protein AQI88_19620 [Streptomyces cellostaticus]
MLLLALLVPGTHAQAQTAPAPTVSAETVETVEHDALDTLARPPAGAVHRADVPERPAPVPDPASAPSVVRSCPAVPRPPYALPLLRTVILRC